LRPERLRVALFKHPRDGYFVDGAFPHDGAETRRAGSSNPVRTL